MPKPAPTGPALAVPSARRDAALHWPAARGLSPRPSRVLAAAGHRPTPAAPHQE